ncbi:hypothetical protein ARMA_3105 [Ardenticatena maritima]|uniref:DUF624 domain-containing protein n=1 Tax=Ardenticatena maritima TaxID=872965 RepID=A0A0M8KBK3_9CHLR|nr:hypothetical protein [Ardenticatena maritima]KPL86336.1 hypothetical protein SE16_13495 [Ardenticatena maritima]GAP64682.1 hypothetical protein ARMA_3105 [Ardenticatena maritima]
MLLGAVFGRFLRDLWDEAFLILLMGIVGGLLGMTVVLIPLVLMAHATLAWRIVNGYAVSWRDWVKGARQHWIFGYTWAFIVLAVTMVLLVNWQFYAIRDAAWARLMQGIIVGAFFVALAVLPMAPLFYVINQTHRLAWRNSVLLGIRAMGSMLLLWLFVGLVSLVVYLFVPPFIAIAPLLFFLAGGHMIRAVLDAQENASATDTTRTP